MRFFLAALAAISLSNQAFAYSNKSVRQMIPAGTKKISVTGNGIDGAKVTVVKTDSVQVPQIEIVIVADNEEGARDLEANLAMDSQDGEVTISSRISLYMCQIGMVNGSITYLKGSCFFQTVVYLPTNSQIEVYGDGQLRSERINAITNAELIAAIEEAHFSGEKVKIVDHFLESYNGRGKPVLKAAEVSQVVSEIDFDSDKMKAFKKLAPFVIDRNTLVDDVDDCFSFDSSRKEALKFLMTLPALK